VGLEYVASIAEDDAKALVDERERGGAFGGVVELAQRTSLSQVQLEALVASGACDSFGARRTLLWELGLVPRSESVPGSAGEERQLALPLDPTTETPPLRDQTAWERMLADYRLTSVSVGTHPLALLRPHLDEGVLSSERLESCRHGRRVRVAGMTVARQRPSTANGVVFMLLEDELGQMNLIVPPPVYERHRLLVRTEPLILAEGRLERLPQAGGAINVYVRTLRALVTPEDDAADVVALAERRAEAVTAADFRGVAPAVQSFAAGRRR
jgi:error-prone DNA polymerase